MSYIDAGYTVILVVLAGYGATLWIRRRRLERAAGTAAGRGERR